MGLLWQLSCELKDPMKQSLLTQSFWRSKRGVVECDGHRKEWSQVTNMLRGCVGFWIYSCGCLAHHGVGGRHRPTCWVAWPHPPLRHSREPSSIPTTSLALQSSLLSLLASTDREYPQHSPADGERRWSSGRCFVCMLCSSSPVYCLWGLPNIHSPLQCPHCPLDRNSGHQHLSPP